MDELSKAERSDRMRNVRQKGTAPELAARKAFRELGLRYRLNDKRLPGRPDLVIAKWRAVVFIHGCFWHGHDCKKARLPKSNHDFWAAKRIANVARDRAKERELQARGWRVFTIWECETTKPETLSTRITAITTKILAAEVAAPPAPIICVRQIRYSESARRSH